MSMPFSSNRFAVAAISFKLDCSNLASMNEVPAWRPMIDASVTARIGGVSIITKSYCVDNSVINLLKRSPINSSDGFGGILPREIKSRFSISVGLIAFAVSMSPIRLSYKPCSAVTLNSLWL